jgi:hypothetical protein
MQIRYSHVHNLVVVVKLSDYADQVLACVHYLGVVFSVA